MEAKKAHDSVQNFLRQKEETGNCGIKKVAELRKISIYKKKKTLKT